MLSQGASTLFFSAEFFINLFIEPLGFCQTSGFQTLLQGNQLFFGNSDIKLANGLPTFAKILSLTLRGQFNTSLASYIMARS